MRLRSSKYFCLAALFFALISLGLLTLVRQETNRLQALELTAAEVARIDAESDPERAAAEYNELKSDNPLIQIRIMRRRWQQLLTVRNLLKNGSTENPGPGPKDIALQQEFDRLRFTLQETGEALLKLRPAPETAWRVHNLLGASYLLQAAVILEKGKSLKQGQAALNLAINHFKEAVTAIDKDPEARDLDNIPRWNLELLATGKSRSELTRTVAGNESRLDLKKNLSTMLPESAGYMVGEPPDNRVRK